MIPIWTYILIIIIIIAITSIFGEPVTRLRNWEQKAINIINKTGYSGYGPLEVYAHNSNTKIVRDDEKSIIYLNTSEDQNKLTSTFARLLAIHITQEDNSIQTEHCYKRLFPNSLTDF